ncbi:MAG: Serine/threonine-protein kinase [Myxococcales bacterium]|nr:Serine/threonine-protein kinase [Myxococcales bacterium]
MKTSIFMTTRTRPDGGLVDHDDSLTPALSSRIDSLPERFVENLSRQELRVGDVLVGRYRLVQPLGGGGMGQVFVAENLIGRRVAIKVLRPDLLADPSFRRRFQKEAEAIASIDHPNVVRFLDLVVSDPTFLVMEYLQGPTLSAVLKAETRLAPARAIAIIRRLCWGLEAAHQAGVIHRDIKPSNIILGPDVEVGEQPKLLDFGVAKVGISSPEDQLTRAGQIIGSPHYMSPEQITGGEIGPRSDIYSLGCLTYHLLSGAPPFVGTEEFNILSQHVSAEPPPLTGVAADVAQIVSRALAKNPAVRFESMKEMATALHAAEARGSSAASSLDSPTRAFRRPAATSESGKRWATPTLLGIGVMIFALGVVLGALLLRKGADVARNGIIIVSDPAGAVVEVDGKRVEEVTPTAVALARGTHRIVLRRQGLGTVERTVEVDGEAHRRLVEVVLPPQSRRIVVKTAPPGATIYVDRTLAAGTTPTTINVVDDDFHEIRAELAGYEILVHALKPEDKDPELMLELTPEKNPTGTVSVDANGAADVWLDGVSTAYVTPTLAFQLPVGAHVIELRGAGGLRSLPVHIMLRRGENLHLTMALVTGAAR